MHLHSWRDSAEQPVHPHHGPVSPVLRQLDGRLPGRPGVVINRTLDVLATKPWLRPCITFRAARQSGPHDLPRPGRPTVYTVESPRAGHRGSPAPGGRPDPDNRGCGNSSAPSPTQRELHPPVELPRRAWQGLRRPSTSSTRTSDPELTLPGLRRNATRQASNSLSTAEPGGPSAQALNLLGSIHATSNQAPCSRKPWPDLPDNRLNRRSRSDTT